MNTTYKSFTHEAETDVYQNMASLIKKNPWAWQSICAVLGLAGGVFAPIFGAISDVMKWFVNSGALKSHLGIVSIVLYALTIPLLILSAYCLDLLEAKTKSTHLSSPTEALRNESTPAASTMRIAQQSAHHCLNRSGVLVVLFFLLALPATGYAQQTIFNVPTTDVLDQGHVYFEMDISAKPNEPKFSSFVPRIVIGAGRHVEVGLNVTGNIQPGPDSTTLVPAVKWKVYDGKDNGWAIAVGNNLYLPVRDKSYDLGTYSYTMVQKTFSTKTRVGFGGYFFSRNVVSEDANRMGGQFTFEQPVNTKLTLAADWFTGRHGAGYFTPGAIFKISQKVTGYASYSIGNQNPTRGNHFFLIEVGYNFN